MLGIRVAEKNKSTILLVFEPVCVDTLAGIYFPLYVPVGMPCIQAQIQRNLGGFIFFRGPKMN